MLLASRRNPIPTFPKREGEREDVAGQSNRNKEKEKIANRYYNAFLRLELRAIALIRNVGSIRRRGRQHTSTAEKVVYCTLGAAEMPQDNGIIPARACLYP